MSILVVLAGPNGSGKTSLYDEVADSPHFPELFISPDDIAEGEPFRDVPDILERYHAAMAYAECQREKALAHKTPLAFETVMSTRGKLDFLRTARSYGYFIELIFVNTSDPDINIARIAQRKSSGGHDVPTEKVLARYERSLSLLPEALTIADVAKVYDNSGPHPILCYFKRADNTPLLLNREIRPSWVMTAVVEPLLASGVLTEIPKDLNVADTVKVVERVYDDRIAFMERKVDRTISPENNGREDAESA